MRFILCHDLESDCLRASLRSKVHRSRYSRSRAIRRIVERRGNARVSVEISEARAVWDVPLIFHIPRPAVRSFSRYTRARALSRMNAPVARKLQRLGKKSTFRYRYDAGGLSPERKWHVSFATHVGPFPVFLSRQSS